MDMTNFARTVGTAASTGDDSNATLFIVIMVVMALIIVGMVVFSVVSGRKNKENSEGKGTEDKKDDSKK